jgi:hypothetical protein
MTVPANGSPIGCRHGAGASEWVSGGEAPTEGSEGEP